MKVPKTDGKKDLTRLIYNAHITVSGIPPEAYDWAVETMHNPRYPLELFMRVVTVSLETMKIVNGLPPLEIASD